MPAKKLFILCCLLGAFVGCAHEEGIVPPVTGMPAPQALFDKLTSDPAPGKTLEGFLNVVVSHPGKRYTFRMAAAAAKKPDRLRLEDLSVIGLPDFVLTVNDTDVRMFLPPSGEFFSGPASSERLMYVFPFSMKPADLVALLYGQPPGVNAGEKDVRGSMDGNRFRLDVYAQGRWIQSLWIDPATGLPARLTVADASGNTAYRVVFADFTAAGSATVPARIEIETEGMGQIRISLRNTDIELTSRDDDPDFFLLKPPGGSTPHP